MRYEFTVVTSRSDVVLDAFPELREAEAEGKRTTLYGAVQDRAHLDGLLARFRNLGLDLVDMHRLPD